jgi:curved DNA-binding protein CbpA
LGAAQSSPGGIIELPVDIQNELRQLEERGEKLTHYELLGVSADADARAIRRAYLEKSKRFHPDAWYRKETGGFGPLLSKWFQRLSAAYQVLSDEETRAGYDRDHRAELSQSDKVALERRELSVAEEERRAREGRERMLRTKGFARIGAARKLYEEALEYAQNGERTQAIFALKAARDLDPKRNEISAKLVELEREQAKARANSALASAKEREEKRRFAEAITAYSAAFQNDPGCFAAAMGAARCATETGDAKAATIWASRAVELKPDDGEARWLLSRLFVSAGMKARARTELTALLNKNPDHKEAKALLRTL